MSVSKPHISLLDERIRRCMGPGFHYQDGLRALDELVEQLEAHRTFADHFLQWCETVAAEEDNPIHLLVREAEALNPASEPEAS